MTIRFTRRQVLRSALMLGGSGLAFGAYASWVEPRFRLAIREYRISPSGWPAGLRLTAAFISDLHASEPYMSTQRIAGIVETTNTLKPDIILLGGDYCGGAINKPFIGPAIVAPILADLHAPLGRHAVFGNHDHNIGIASVRRAFAVARIPTLENAVNRIETEAGAFWLAGTASALAYWLRRGSESGPEERPIVTIHGRRFRGADDLPGTLAKITDDAPVLLLAHEPDQFAQVPERVALTFSGHTHGGQVYIPGIGRPFVPSLYGERYAYGHIVENGRHLVVSGGLGLSFLPVRALCPPEITLVRISASFAA